MSPSPPRLGQLLVDLGFIDEAQLDAALRQQEERGGRLGKILVDNAVITEERLTHALSRQLGIDSCDPVDTPVHPKVLELIPAETALELRVLPMARKREGEVDVVYVALSDPLEQRAMEAVRQALGNGARVHWMIAGESEMELALEKKYGRPAPHQAAVRAQEPSFYQGVPVVQGLPFKADLPQRRGSAAARPSPPGPGGSIPQPGSSSGSVPAAALESPSGPSFTPAADRSASSLFGKPGGFDLQTDFEGLEDDRGPWPAHSAGPAEAPEDGINYEAFGTLQSVDMQPVEDEFDGIEGVDIEDGPSHQVEAEPLDLSPALDGPPQPPDDGPSASPEVEALEEADSRDIEPLDEDDVEPLDDDVELIDDVEPLDEPAEDAPGAGREDGSSDVVALPASPSTGRLDGGTSALSPSRERERERPAAGLEAVGPQSEVEAEAIAGDEDSVEAIAPPADAFPGGGSPAAAPPAEEEHVSEDLPEFSPGALSAFSERVSHPPPVVATRELAPPLEDELPPVRKPAPRVKSSPDPALKWGDLLEGLTAPKAPAPADDAEGPREASTEIAAEPPSEATGFEPEPTATGSETLVEATALEAGPESEVEREAVPEAPEPTDDVEATLDVGPSTQDVEPELGDAFAETTSADGASASFEAEPTADGQSDEIQPEWAEWVRATPRDALRSRLAAALRVLAENGLFDLERLEAEVESIQAKNDVRLE